MPGSQAVLLSPLIGGVGPKSLVLHLDDLDGSAPQREFEPTKSQCKIAGTKQHMFERALQHELCIQNKRKEACFASWR